MDYQKLPLFIHDYPQDAVINPDHENLNYKLPKKLIYAFVTKENIDKFLARYSYRIVGSMETISFNPNVYEIDYEGQKIGLCQAPLGAPAATQLLDWLIGYGVKQVLAVGSCGSLEDFEENEFVIPTKAIRDEGTSLHYLPASESIELNSKFVQRVEQTLQDFNYRIHEVITWTTDGFYRETIELVNRYRKQGVATVEMECAALAACSQFRNVDFAQILFTADSLKDVDNYDERDFGINSHLKVLKIATKVMAKLKN